MSGDETQIDPLRDPDATIVDHRVVPPECDGVRTTRLLPRSAGGEREPTRGQALVATCFGLAITPVRVAVGAMLFASVFVAIVEHEEAQRLRRAMAAGSAVQDVANDAPAAAVPVRIGSIEIGLPRIVSLAQVREQAIDSIRSNDFDQALVSLELLQQESPENQTYADFVVALRWKLRCQEMISDDGGAC